MIDNNLANALDISKLPEELREVISRNPLVFNQALIDGFEKIRQDFEVIESDEKTPLISFEIQDIMQPAKDSFNPTEGAVKFGARLPEFHDIDIDLSLKRSDVLSFVRSYLKYVTGLKTQEEAIANPWPLFFLKQILEKAGRDLALISAYQAVRNESGSTSKDIMNGLLFKLAEGRATGGDIKTANVYVSSRTGVEFDANVYEEANKIAQLTENDPDIAGRAMTLEMSPRTYRLYKENRRAKSPNMVALSEQPTTLDDYPNIKIKVEQGLGNKRFMWLTLDGNKFFTFNQNYQNFNVKLIEDVKGWKANIFFSADVNYGTGRYVYSNNRVD